MIIVNDFDYKSDYYGSNNDDNADHKIVVIAKIWMKKKSTLRN